MPNPTLSDIHVSRPLTNVLMAYVADETSFVADRVFPNIPVQKQADSYYKYDRSDWWRASFRKRAPATESAGTGWKMSTDTYFADVWALHVDIADQIRANADDPINLDRDAVNFLAGQALLTREVQWASTFFTTGVWTGSDTGTDIPGAIADTTAAALYWNDANSDPIGDIAAQSTAMQLKTGKRPNTLVLGRQVYDALRRHPDIVDLIKYGGGPNAPALITNGALAQVLDIERIFVMDGIQVTSAENPAFETSMTTAFIAGKHALLCYVPRRPGLYEVSAGYTFSWTGFMGAGAIGARIKRIRMELIEADRIEAQMAFDQKITSPDLGVFFSNIVQ